MWWWRRGNSGSSKHFHLTGQSSIRILRYTVLVCFQAAHTITFDPNYFPLIGLLAWELRIAYVSPFSLLSIQSTQSQGPRNPTVRPIYYTADVTLIVRLVGAGNSQLSVRIRLSRIPYLSQSVPPDFLVCRISERRVERGKEDWRG